jgi:hypothetical protein
MQNIDQAKEHFSIVERTGAPSLPPALPDTERRFRKLESANRRQSWAIVVLFVVAVCLAFSMPSARPVASGLPAVDPDGNTVVDALHVKNQIVVGEYPNVIYLQTGETMGAWVWVRAGKTRSAFVHVPMKEHGQPTFALYDDGKERLIKAELNPPARLRPAG